MTGLLSEKALCGATSILSQGQHVYVPVYSSIRIGELGRPYDLAVTLCVRNTDQTHTITVTSADYYDSNGKMLRRFLDAPRQVGPLASVDFFIRASDVSGGLFPSFLVKWKSSQKVNEPIIEAIMIGDKHGQGISFACPGKVIKESSE
ncbi:MAG: DUF3124 domain-containing protein [Deltaproteobacteria bacterium]|nr:DUF3124 domain-containing protein [Deltaproteobacteria bacterium]